MFASLRFRRHRERLYTVIIVLAGIALAVAAALFAQDYAIAMADEGFRREVAGRSAALDASIARHEQMVRSLAAFVATRETVSAADFRTFVDTMRAGTHGMQAMQWMPRVDAASRAAFEQAARADFPAFHITEQTSLRPEYFPVRLIEPVAGNEAAVGYDALADPLLRDAIRRAATTSEVVASERVVLMQEEDGVRYGLMLVAQVSGHDGKPRGFVAGVFRIGDLLESSIAALPPVGLHLSVTDATGPGPERTLHVFSDRLSEVSDLLAVPFEARPAGATESLLATHDLHVADRIWRVYFESGPGYFAPLPPAPAWMVAGIVLLITGVLATWLLLMQKRAQLLARASLADGLTGLANRAFCDRMLTAEWDRAIRYGKPLSIVVIDIDRFVDFNMQFGPLAGDDCLRRIAQVLTHVPGRSSDFVCRYAGDRFVVVLPETGHAGAHDLATRASQAVRALRLAHPGRQPEPVVTVSVVAATAGPQRGDSLPAFVMQATELLDSAERQEGNVVLGLSVTAS